MRRLGFFVSVIAGLIAIVAMPSVIDAQSGRGNEQQVETYSTFDNPLRTPAGLRYMTEQPRHWRACMIQR